MLLGAKIFRVLVSLIFRVNAYNFSFIVLMNVQKKVKLSQQDNFLKTQFVNIYFYINSICSVIIFYSRYIITNNDYFKINFDIRILYFWIEICIANNYLIIIKILKKGKAQIKVRKILFKTMPCQKLLQCNVSRTTLLLPGYSLMKS